jgi:hypothetical protein
MLQQHSPQPAKNSKEKSQILRADAQTGFKILIPKQLSSIMLMGLLHIIKTSVAHVNAQQCGENQASKQKS